MVYCCVPFCKSESRKGKPERFHEFPSDMVVRGLWLKAISRENFTINDKSRSSVVCSLHFRSDDYIPGLKICKLKKGAVPSVFPGYPQYKVPRVIPTRRKIERNVCDDRCAKQAKIESVSQNSVSVEPEVNSLHDTELCSRKEVAEFLVNLPEHINLLEKREDTKKKVRTANCRAKSGSTRKLQNMRSLLWKKNKKILLLQKEIKTVKSKLNSYEQHHHYSTLKNILEMADEGDIKASFLLQQLENFARKKPLWNEETIRECILWEAASPKGYQFVREEGLLTLPAKMTLRRFLGPMTGETGVTNLIKERLKEEADRLNGFEKFCSLIIDEMALKEQHICDKTLDSFYGQRTVPENNDSGRQPLANKLLCFLLSGLSTSYKIPCGYFFTRALTGSQLKELVYQVIKAVEECGYLVIRIVTDNHKTNAAMLRQLSISGKALTHKIKHPLNDERVLFLSFDPNHIIKNLRSLFFKNEMTDGEEIISGKFIKYLYHLQKRENIKAVRNLTLKHVAPTNFDKMNVARAVLIFSPPVTAALEFLRKISSHHSQAAPFADSGATITFLKNIYSWFSVHDVSNRQQHAASKNRDRMHFFSCNDERLEWLQTEFLNYMKAIKEKSEKEGLKFLSKETYEALTLTTMSTVECTKYLLKQGFHYVLTQSFNSDPVESLFSALRQMNGGNHIMDCRSTITSLEKILKTGTFIASKASNVGRSRLSITTRPSVLKHHEQKHHPAALHQFPDHILELLDVLQSPPGNTPTTLRSASLAFVAGYLVRVLEENLDCAECVQKFSTADCPSPLFQLITQQNRGGLLYPTVSFVVLLSLLDDFVKAVQLYLPQTAVVQSLTAAIKPRLEKYPLLKCSSIDHPKKLADLLCRYFLPILMKNFSKTVTDLNRSLPSYEVPFSRRMRNIYS